MPLTEEQIADLKSKHGAELRAVEIGDVTLVFRKPKRPEYDHWYERRETHAQAAGRELAQQCIVFPTFAEMMSVLDASPAVLSATGGIVDALLDLAGLGTAKQKKL